ncbi:hypothetical protein HAX54_043434, partial [Datura stramonium]|nr:hypothetical protein [Datura stramonium]
NRCTSVRAHNGGLLVMLILRYYDSDMLAGFSVEKLFIGACVILLMKMVDKTEMSAGGAS